MRSGAGGRPGSGATCACSKKSCCAARLNSASAGQIGLELFAEDGYIEPVCRKGWELQIAEERARTEAIKRQALKLGFDLVGVAPVGPVPELAFYQEWIEAGYAGEMAYLERNADRKADVRHVVPEARSVIVCAKIYHTDQPLSIEKHDPARGWISRYAWGDDYHDVMPKKLFELFDFVQGQSDESCVGRVYVDTGPVIDRVYAKYAGIGWFGKNTCIINQEKGSWFFLGEIIVSLALEYDEPVPDRCGTCSRCIDACPTDAILAPYELDARRCISYLTIETKGDIPEALRDGVGNHIFGCDICQDVCPWNRRAATTPDAAFGPRPGLVNPALEEIAAWDLEQFRERLRHSPLKRAKYRGLQRNLAVAMGNSRDRRFLPVLERWARSEDERLREHAIWALKKIDGEDG